MSWREFKMQKDPDCPICGSTPTIQALIDYEGFCGMPAREGAAGEALPQCAAVDLAKRRAAGEKMVLLDVREADEIETARIDGSIWIPLGDLESRGDELEPFRDRPIVVHCHHGGRSLKATQWLHDHGFETAENLDGGIEAWSLTVDPSVPRY
jgi:adenylyltransferase/sulfurtransferase